MSCEVAVAVPVPEINGAFASEAEALTPEEWMIVRLYRGLGENDQAWMRRMFSALAARTVPD
ncbi:TPA: hypothetical protein N1970_003382 [Pseudomonas aeruginosa 059A]|nr:hypothetical protein [Pseudomonas aeruginosa 059A]HCL2955125.1 hypothetical protein [Pseudomonas aeruginosa 059A]HCL2967573.1 hypothetical protein [Pseudomonas aeruginosa 059A]HCL2973734.1 hypothetical protein [Pseudomonas aeruginosa 059A]HCL2986539.1 hypothetical protein [Pseudomonas aeruginosa 059A]